MNILLFISSLRVSSGGPARLVIDSALELASRGLKITLLSHRDSEFNELTESVLLEKLRRANIEVSLHNYTVRSLGFSFGLKKYIDENLNKFECIHIHGIWEPMFIYCGWRFRKNRNRYIVSCHGMLEEWSLSQSKFKKKIFLKVLGGFKFLSQASALVVGTKYEAERSLYFGCGLEYKVISNSASDYPIGFNIDNKISRVFYDFRRKWRRVFVYMGRLHPKKGLLEFLKVFSEYSRSKESSGLLILGLKDSQSYENEVISIINKSRINDRVCYFDSVTNLHARGMMRLADVFVLTSFQEGMSIAILEAMADAMPLLVSDKCNLLEVEQVWECGKVVEMDSTQISEAIDYFSNASDQELKAMGARSRAIFNQNFSWNKVCKDLISLYAGSCE